MESVIFNPTKEYSEKYRALHEQNAQKFFDELSEKSGVDIEQNRATVNRYNKQMKTVEHTEKSTAKFRVFKVLSIIGIVISAIMILGFFAQQMIVGIIGAVLIIPLILLLVKVISPTLKDWEQKLSREKQKAEEIRSEAEAQMRPLNALFGDRDAIRLIEKTLPLFEFRDYLSSEHEEDMMTNYDLERYADAECSVVDMLSGRYNENPFIFEKRLVHKMGMETYHGYKTIYWTETYRDSDGRLQTRSRSQTLHAQVTKPKPFYHTETKLYYGSQAAPDLYFSRTATHSEKLSERALEKKIKKGEKKLRKMDEKAVGDNRNFVSMANTEFEVLFGALDRTDEVQFRTLFTPLSQTNLTELICSEVGYGDDFNFNKRKRTNIIFTQHAQSRDLVLNKSLYYSYSYDIIKSNFILGNMDFFKSVYFDFAPLLCIPAYQERPVSSLKPIEARMQKYSCRDYETVLNTINPSYIAHPDTKTNIIVKATCDANDNGTDRISVGAYSYDSLPRVDFVPVWGGDGRMHSVAVNWYEYIPLEAFCKFVVDTDGEKLKNYAVNKDLSAYKNGIFAYGLNN